MSPLEHYFKSNPADNPARLAKRIGRTPATITRIMTGVRDPSLQLALDIQRGTKGKVKAGQIVQACVDVKLAKLRKAGTQ